MLPLVARRCLSGMLGRVCKLDRLPANGGQMLVAGEVNEVVGFAKLEGDGHLDMLYVRADAVGRSVG